MSANHYDIRPKLGTPVWFDENGVPRYRKFRPINPADIYAMDAVLSLVGCQLCDKGFNVATSGEFPDVSDMIRNNTRDHGDPPNVSCGTASMSSMPQAVLQYRSRPQAGGWKRDHRLEVKIRLPWMDADDDGPMQRSTSPVNSECTPPYDLTQP